MTSAINIEEQIKTKTDDRIYKIKYIKFVDSHFFEEEMLMNISISQEIKKRNKRKIHQCFLNSSQTANREFDYVLGFFLNSGSAFYEHAWNRKNDNNLIIDVTIPFENLEKICDNKSSCIYIEVYRFSRDEMFKYILKTKGYSAFYLYIEEYKNKFIDARLAISDFYKAIYIQ